MAVAVDTHQAARLVRQLTDHASQAPGQLADPLRALISRLQDLPDLDQLVTMERRTPGTPQLRQKHRGGWWTCIRLFYGGVPYLELSPPGGSRPLLQQFRAALPSCLSDMETLPPMRHNDVLWIPLSRVS